MKLYIRKKPKYITFLDKPREWFKGYESMVEKRPAVIGDIAYFKAGDIQALLTFLESNPQIDCYSSIDLKSPVILSRFKEVEKEELPPPMPVEGAQNRTLRELYDNQIHDRYSLLIANTPLNKNR